MTVRHQVLQLVSYKVQLSFVVISRHPKDCLKPSTSIIQVQYLDVLNTLADEV